MALLDFTVKGARFRMELGYRDTLCTLRAFLSGELNHPDFAARPRSRRRPDYDQIRVTLLHDDLHSKTTRHMDQLDALLKKYNL